MGTPIESDDDLYDPGANCAACVDVIFGGKTPEFVKAVFANIVACPPLPAVPPVPPIILTQAIGAPCVWLGFLADGGNNWTCQWRVNEPLGPFRSYLILGRAATRDFYSQEIPTCIKSFTNQQTCIGGDATFGGTGVIRWGIEVPPT